MKRDKQIRRIRHLIHKYDSFPYFQDKPLIEYLDYEISLFDGVKIKSFIEKGNGFKELKKLVIETNITKDEYQKIAKEERLLTVDTFENLRLNNLKETRDNKGVYVGSGGSNAHSIRYPKKARSKRVWRIFYKMFPYTAKKDGWDGEKSTKVNK